MVHSPTHDPTANIEIIHRIVEQMKTDFKFFIHQDGDFSFRVNNVHTLFPYKIVRSYRLGWKYKIWSSEELDWVDTNQNISQLIGDVINEQI